MKTKQEKKTQVLALRISQEEKKVLDALLKIVGMGQSEFVRGLIEKEAHRMAALKVNNAGDYEKEQQILRNTAAQHVATGYKRGYRDAIEAAEGSYTEKEWAESMHSEILEDAEKSFKKDNGLTY